MGRDHCTPSVTVGGKAFAERAYSVATVWRRGADSTRTREWSFLTVRAEKVASFLMLFAGEWFRNGDYAREFALSPNVSKRHLKSLCLGGLLELTGTRKAAKYVLAFHR